MRRRACRVIPWYAPVPEPGTIVIGPVTVPSEEQVVWSTGRLSSSFPTLLTSTANEPFDSTIWLLPFGPAPWWSIPLSVMAPVKTTVPRLPARLVSAS